MDIKAQYITTKIHTWRGKYQRLLVIGSNGIATCELSTQSITNEWTYVQDFLGASATEKDDEFIITIKKGNNGYLLLYHLFL